MSNTPPIDEKTVSTLPHLEKKALALSISSAVSMNGTASPSEKIPSKIAPWMTVAAVDAKSSTVPRMGPMQGLQPNANSAPIRSELSHRPTERNFGIFMCHSFPMTGR